MSTPTRYRVIALYKQLSYLGREYPAGADYFHKKLKGAFMKNKDLSDPAEIQKRIDLGDYVCKEIEAMYHINKYRAMKKRYYEDAGADNIQAKLENTNWAQGGGSSATSSSPRQ
ncbi:LYR motif-containing protein 5 [Linnemannia schmuckeri]|uniref:LYR motif-containing protein 5 n=1 Tax=Linnemannia schmuckeri TaxID=64567 RepID=A0A9P5V8H1_9FUNG|nr:LYR motif-containing protein 5 [Linnemannia schmuckeri]